MIISDLSYYKDKHIYYRVPESLIISPFIKNTVTLQSKFDMQGKCALVCQYEI